MRNKFIGAFVVMAVALLGLNATPAAAKPLDAQATKDLRCMLMILRQSNASTAKDKSDYALANHYFLGRIEGHIPSAELNKAAADELGKILKADRKKLAGEYKVCVETYETSKQKAGKAFAQFVKPAAQKQPAGQAKPGTVVQKPASKPAQ